MDTSEHIGAPLTNDILNFIGIAGPNHGALLCGAGRDYAIKLDAFKTACGPITGMGCKSEYLEELNNAFVVFYTLKCKYFGF